MQRDHDAARRPSRAGARRARRRRAPRRCRRAAASRGASRCGARGTLAYSVKWRAAQLAADEVEARDRGPGFARHFSQPSGRPSTMPAKIARADPVVVQERLEAAFAAAAADQGPMVDHHRAGRREPERSNGQASASAHAEPRQQREHRRIARHHRRHVPAAERERRSADADPARRRRGRPSRTRCRRRTSSRRWRRAAASIRAAARSCIAAYAIGMPKPKAMPRYACGSAKKRLV